jgi:hypothetical protein
MNNNRNNTDFVITFIYICIKTLNYIFILYSGIIMRVTSVLAVFDILKYDKICI